MALRIAIGAIVGAGTGGCVARAAWDVATLPVRAGSKAVDWTTTSRDEADRNYGRKVRKQRERAAREARRDERRRDRSE